MCVFLSCKMSLLIYCRDGGDFFVIMEISFDLEIVLLRNLEFYNDLFRFYD